MDGGMGRWIDGGSECSRLRSSEHNADSFDRLVKLVNIASVHMGAREVLDIDGWTNVIRAADLDLDASDARRLYTWIQSTEGRKKNVLGKIDILFSKVHSIILTIMPTENSNLKENYFHFL